MFEIKSIATHNLQNGNTWSVRLQVLQAGLPVTAYCCT